MSNNIHVQLLTEFTVYETKNPGASIDDFCRSRMLANEKLNRKLVDGVLPPEAGTLLIKMIYRIGRLSYVFCEEVLSNLTITTFEEFSLLNAIYALKSPRKSEVAMLTLTEYTTGIDIINRLKKKKLVIEKNDHNDKRSKNIAITREGLKTLKLAYERFGIVNSAMLGGMSEQDKHLCIHILQDVEIRCSDMYKDQRGLSEDTLKAALAVI